MVPSESKRVLILCDGPRDEVVLPHILERLVGRSLACTTRVWSKISLHRGSGYRKKALFSLVSARTERMDGVAAVVDRDNDHRGKRLEALKMAREAFLDKHPPIPMTVGEAIPHGEAWLLDDATAVRRILEIDDSVSVPNMKTCKDPKSALEELIGKSHRAEDPLMEVLSELAREIDPSKYAHPASTGFQAFRKDLDEQIEACACGPR